MILHDRVVVVSGVGPGLGRAIAVQCARAGAHVVLAARTKDRLEAVAEEVGALDRRAVVAPTDITDEDSAERLLATARQELGRVDTLVNNAFAMPPMQDLGETPFDALRTSFEVNVLAALRLTRLFAPALAEHAGSAVMVNSAVLRHSRQPYGPYKMAKASLLALAQSLSTELGPRGIRVNSVAPGWIWGETLRWYFGHLAAERGVSAQQVYDETAAALDLRRLPEAEEVADVVVFLASRLARAVTGQCVDVNAGEFHH
ncbi:MAG TPA: SDR family oxidoreductase [Nocardioidaceae bacterium]|nr:SDR family oxidoreductase [Nocardioidaceae bacterium]